MNTSAEVPYAELTERTRSDHKLDYNAKSLRPESGDNTSHESLTRIVDIGSNKYEVPKPASNVDMESILKQTAHSKSVRH